MSKTDSHRKNSQVKQSKSRLSKISTFLRGLVSKNQIMNLGKDSRNNSTRYVLADLHGITNDQISARMESLMHKIVEDVMTPRSDIIAASIDATAEELCHLMIKHKHTRILVFNESLDNMIGFVHIQDLFELVVEQKKFNLHQLIRKHIIAPQSMKLIDLLIQMQLTHTHIAVIVDEYGGTDGLVTVEDIMQEIVGRIDDKHSNTEQEVQVLSPGVIVTNARVSVIAIERIIGVPLKSVEDTIDTIGGLVISISGNVPIIGEVIKIKKDILAEIIEATPRTVKRIKISYPVKTMD